MAVVVVVLRSYSLVEASILALLVLFIVEVVVLVLRLRSLRMGSCGLSSWSESILGAGTCSSSLLKLAVCWLSADGLSVNLEKAP